MFNTVGVNARVRAAANAPVIVLVIILVMALAIALTPTANAHAQGSDEQRRGAIASAMGQAGGQGKVISVKPQQTSSGQPGFRVRILTEGRVRTFDVPAGGSN